MSRFWVLKLASCSSVRSSSFKLRAWPLASPVAVQPVSVLSLPRSYLVVPRFLACVLLIPLLTLMADFMGVIGGAVVSTQMLGVDSFHYWNYSRVYVGGLDLLAGVFKSYFFGAAIALISCHRGFHSRAGAEGVGRAATEAFVYSFIAILVLDFGIGILWNAAYNALWPESAGLL